MINTIEEFWDLVIPTSSGCFEFTGPCTKGYGHFYFNGIKVYAHRFAWELVNGAIPKGMQVLHRCDYPPCCNVKKCLFLGTVKDNMVDKAAKGRHHEQRVTECPSGHPYNEKNTYIDPTGGRRCRECNKVTNARWRKAKLITH